MQKWTMPTQFQSQELTLGIGVANTKMLSVGICVNVFGVIQEEFRLLSTFHFRGTRWRVWLRHCTTNRKAAGSIPDGVIGIFS